MSQYPAKQAVFGERLRIPPLPDLPSVALPPLAALPDLSQASQPQQEASPQTAPLAAVPRPKRPHVDALVAANRAKTPLAATDQRTKPRLSISELNEMDTDELRDRYLNSRYDNRTPIQQVLDIIDLPRNAIANVLFHDAADKQAQAGEFGTFGLPRVTTSDALRDMGVENRVALALGGFVGDVALDPLTYLGPAGWGVQAGKVAIRGGGKKILSKAAKEAAAGGIDAVSDPIAKGLFRAAGVADATGDAKKVRAAVYGDATGGIVEDVLRPLGADQSFAGGVFAKYANMAKTAENVAEHANIDAVQNFIKQYGRGTGGGIKIGTGGSEIAHIPGTDITLQVPAFTSTAARGLAALNLARDRDLSNALGKTEKGADSAVSVAKPIIDSMRDDMLKAADANAVAIGADEGFKVGDFVNTKPNSGYDSFGEPRLVVDIQQHPEHGTYIKVEGSDTYLPADTLDKGATPDAPTVYHGTSATFDNFRATDEGIYFSDNPAIAKQYADNPGMWLSRSAPEGARVIESKVDLKNPLVIDALGNRHDNIPFPGQPWKPKSFGNLPKDAVSVREAAKRAKAMGHDGLVVRNVLDTKIPGDKTKSTVYVAFDHSQVRSATTPPPPPAVAAKSFAEEASAKADALGDIIRGMPPEKIANLNANGIAHLGELYREAESLRDLAVARARVYENASDPESLAQAFTDVANAATRYQAIIGGTLRQHLDPKTLAASEQIRQMLGTDDFTTGITALGSLKSATGNLFGHENAVTRRIDATDRFVRNKFGIRNGEVPKQIADIFHRANAGQVAKLQEVHAGYRSEMAKVMDRHNIPVTMIDDVLELAGMYQHQAAAQRIGKPIREAMHLKKVVNGKLERGDFEIRLNKLISDMRNVRASRQFYADLKALATKADAQVYEFKQAEQAAWQLKRGVEFYVPHTASVDAQLAMKGKKSTLAWESQVTSDHPSPREAFQTHRTTDVYQFQSKDGEWMTFREMDRDRAAKTPLQLKELARGSPEQVKEAENIKELQRIIAAYDDLGEAAPPPRPDNVQSLNRAAADGKFGKLSIDPTKDFFDTSIATWMGRRAASHERAMAYADLAKLMNKHGIMNAGEFLNIVGEANSPAKSLTLPGGTSVHVRTVTGAFGEPVVVMTTSAGESFRPLSRGMGRFTENPLIAPMWNAGKDLVLPEKIADMIEARALAFKDENLGTILNAAEEATAAFRSVTLLHPSWMIFDVVGNILNAASGDINVGKMVKNLRQGLAVKLAEGNPEKLKDLVVNLPTGELRGQAALDYFKGVGSLDRNFPQNMGAALTMQGATGMPSQFAREGFIADIKTDNAFNMASLSGSLSKPGAAAASGLRIGWDRINRHVLAPWVRINGVVNDAMRTAAHIALLEQGYDTAGATDKMRRALFDYSDMTHFERKYMRTLFPFYSWMRNNLPYQMSLLFQRPGYTAMAPKVQEALEEALAGEQQVPMGLRPNWMRQALATQIGEDPDSRMAYILGNSSPQTEVYHILQSAIGWKGAQEALHYFGSSINPIISAPLQLGAGQEYFSGRQIGSDVGEGDITATEFLTNLVRPVAEVRKIADAAQRGTGQAVARGLIGGRVQDFSEQRITSTRARELREQVEGLRRAITRLEARGNKPESLRARAKLLRVYKEAVDLGLDKEVQAPKWAKKAIASFAEVPVGG